MKSSASGGRARGREARVWLPIDDEDRRLSDLGRRRTRHFRPDRCGKYGQSWLGSRLLGRCLCCIGNAPYGGAGVAANDAADERISAVEIATGGAHRICAEG